MPEAVDFRPVERCPLDLVGDCGTISIVSRIWLAILTFAFIAIAGSRDAGAQVFKPRGKPGAKTTTPVKAAPAKKAPAARKADSPSRVAAKTPKKSRAADEARPSDLTPAPKKGKKAGKTEKAKPEESGPEIGDDEVIITDDDD